MANNGLMEQLIKEIEGILPKYQLIKTKTTSNWETNFVTEVLEIGSNLKDIREKMLKIATREIMEKCQKVVPIPTHGLKVFKYLTTVYAQPSILIDSFDPDTKSDFYPVEKLDMDDTVIEYLSDDKIVVCTKRHHPNISQFQEWYQIIEIKPKKQI